MIFAGLTPEKVRFDFLSAERYQEWCDQIWSADRRSGRPRNLTAPRAGSVVYAKTDHNVPLFAALAKSRARVVLVTAESDAAVDNRMEAITPPQVAAWFSTNAQSRCARPLPLGLGNSYCTVTNKAPALADALEAAGARNKLLYVNFRSSSNMSVREPLLASFSARRQESWFTVRSESIGPADFLREMTQHKFVLCPAGNGIDSHRIWEALYTGTVPVVQNHPVFRDFQSLPILFVDDLAAVDEHLLSRAWSEMNSRDWNLELLFGSRWRKQVEESRSRISGAASRVGFGAFFLSKLGLRIPA